jgi:hypothetical protein
LGHGSPPNENEGKSRPFILAGCILIGIGAVSVIAGILFSP